MEVSVNIGALLVSAILMVMGALLGIVWHNLNREILRIETESKARAADLRAEAKTLLGDFRADVGSRLEKGDKRFSELEKESNDVAKSINELKGFMKDALAQFRLDMIKDHPTKEDWVKMINANDTRFGQLDRDLRDLVSSVVDRVPQRRKQERAT